MLFTSEKDGLNGRFIKKVVNNNNYLSNSKDIMGWFSWESFKVFNEKYNLSPTCQNSADIYKSRNYFST